MLQGTEGTTVLVELRSHDSGKTQVLSLPRMRPKPTLVLSSHPSDKMSRRDGGGDGGGVSSLSLQTLDDAGHEVMGLCEDDAAARGMGG